MSSEYATDATESMTIKAVEKLQRQRVSAKVQKLSWASNLRDLNSDLLAWLGTSKEEETREGARGGYRLVFDLPHDVWVCQIGKYYGYGKTFAEAVMACQEPVHTNGPD